ncbi:STY0301 family protein [Rhodopseudomonas sp. B29]|uniref:STY0301 family protein n=1 Tax=Rhodopseudomonas sp. B29 TaxID=95607 RepID=UPI0003499838|nr:STY0301 family protein [Rhodopseudomonas sp. B29]
MTIIEHTSRRDGRPAGPTILVLSAFVVSAPLAHAQSGAATIACPPTVDLSYSGVARLPYAGRDYDIAGFQPNFTPVGARLIAAEVAPLADASNELQSAKPASANAADSGEVAFKLSDEGLPAPKSPLAITCRYEGGYALQRALSTTTQRCTLSYQKSRPPTAETTTRYLYTSAVFTCR